MINRWLLRCVISAGVALSSVSAQAQVLDQSHLPVAPYRSHGLTTPITSSWPWYGQSFTAGLTGQLSFADLAIWRQAGATQDLVLKVFTGHASTVNVWMFTLDELLGTITVPGAAVPIGSDGAVPMPPSGADPVGLHVDLSSLGIQVTAGQLYAIFVSTAPQEPVIETHQFGWVADGGQGTFVDLYPAGQVLFRFSPELHPGDETHTFDFDHGFRTYVTEVPEVPSVQLVALGLLMLTAGASIRQRRGI